MSASPPQPPGSASSAESLFIDWLSGDESGQGSDFETLCRARPEYAERLRELHAHWKELDEMRARFGRGSPVARRIAQLFGPDQAPGVELHADEDDKSDFTFKLLGRLADRTPSSKRYSLKGEIASGGMGAILRVWDEDLRRYLAMKVMLTKDLEQADAQATQVDRRRLARFLEEAQVTGQLDHPGIVPVHEVGLDAEGRIYFTMKLVKGRDLKAIFDLVHEGREGWTQVRALVVLLKVCEAMRYAHDKRVIHRDLKPANVMVGRYGEVFVMDWGLGRILDKDDSKDIRLASDSTRSVSMVRSDRREHGGDSDEPMHTMDGDVVGTPAYMPPEQAMGWISEMGPHSDVYAVGAMLYHLLSGRKPYSEPGVRVSNISVWQRVQEGPPPPVRDLAPDAPEELIAICEKAMERIPPQRYQDMTALAADLSAYLEQRVVSAYETGAWAEARKWVQRNRPLAAALIGALLVLVAGLITSSSLYMRAEENAQRAEAKEREALAEKEKVLRLSDSKRLQEYTKTADELWPARPDKIEEMRAWLAGARDLAQKRPLHMATLEALRAQATADPEGWRFADTETQWQHDLLSELVAGLATFSDPDPFVGSIASVERRLESALTITERTVEGREAAMRWGEAIAAVRGNPRYSGLQMAPQLGLLPIGADPETGLWEFAHVESGAPAERDADGRLIVTDATGIVLVLLPGGEFWMGAQSREPHAPNYDARAQANESPVRRMTVSPYFLSKFEATQGQWLRIAGNNPSEWAAGTERHGQALTLRNPVDTVSWLDCDRATSRVDLVLPTEAQWEYAARAGTTTAWSTGDEDTSLAGYANISDRAGKEADAIWGDDDQWADHDDGYALHAPVGSFAPNAFGLHDLQGNVWEWCRDGLGDYLPEVTDANLEPFDASDGYRCIRGGAYYFPSSYARSARRYGQAPSLLLGFLGLRPARPLTP